MESDVYYVEMMFNTKNFQTFWWHKYMFLYLNIYMITYEIYSTDCF